MDRDSYRPDRERRFVSWKNQSKKVFLIILWILIIVMLLRVASVGVYKNSDTNILNNESITMLSNDKVISSIVTIYDKDSAIVKEIKNQNFSNKTINVTTVANGSYELIIIPQNSSIKKVTLNNLTINNQTINFGLEKVPNSNMFLGTDGVVVDSFAVDPSNLNFTNGTIEKTAIGNALYKCKDWNFSEQKCYGTWQKIQNLKKGEDYNITLSSKDPGFAEVIQITKALHLDENRLIISDVYDLVKSLDNNWTNVSNGQYLRISFEKNLTNKNDITIYARSNTSANIEVYEKDSDTKIANFKTIENEGWHKIYLTNLTSAQNTFDLKINDGNVEFDYVVDPTTAPKKAGLFKGSQDELGTNFNHAAFSGLVWSNQSYDMNIFGFNGTNPTRIKVLEDGDYFIALSLPIVDATSSGSNNNRLNIEAMVYVNGASAGISSVRSSYLRGEGNAQDHFESSDQMAILVPNLTANDYVEIQVRGMDDTTEAVKTDNEFVLFAQKVDPAEEIFFASGTDSTAPTNPNNLNQGADETYAYDMKWSSIIKDSIYSHVDNEPNIILADTGYYYATVNIPLAGGVTRSAVCARVELDGTEVAGGRMMQGYIRSNADGNEEASLHWAGLVETSSNNQNLSVAVGLCGATGTVTTGGLNASLYIKKFANGNQGMYHSTATQNTGGDEWNPAAQQYILWTAPNEKDVVYYNHTNNTENITVNVAGYYLLSFNTPQLTSASLRVAPQFTVYVDDVAQNGSRTGSTYIRASSQLESTASLVYLLNLEIGQTIKIGVRRELSGTTTGAVNDEDEGVLLLEYLKTDPKVSWNETTFDLGAREQKNGNLTGITGIKSVEDSIQVNVSCALGNCTQITNNWTNGINVLDGQTASVEFTCSNQTEGSFSATFNVTSANQTQADQIEVSCIMSSATSVVWNQPSLDLGSVYESLETTTNASFFTAGTNNNITIDELFGNGTAFISAVPVFVDSLPGASSQEIMFNCSPNYGQTQGLYEAIYNVNSTEDPTGNNLTVNCTVEKSFVSWNETSIDAGNVYTGTSANVFVDVNSISYNEEVTVTELSGSGASFISPNMTSIGTMNNGEAQQIEFTCSPLSDVSPGAYSARYNVNSTYHEGYNLTVNCTVPTSLINFNSTSLDLVSNLYEGNAIGNLQITSTGISNNTNVSCVSGDCGIITTNWTNGTDFNHNQNVGINFVCNDSVSGTYVAVYNVSSTQNSVGDSTTVNCDIIQSYGILNVSLITPLNNETTNISLGSTFSVNASVTCVGIFGAYCGNVSASIRYNGTGLFGNGSDGEKIVNSLNTIINNYTYININSTLGTTNIIVNDSSEFNPGDEILIIQMQEGMTNCVAGTYEFAKISSINANNITLESPIENNYCYNNPNTVSTDCTDTISGFDSAVAQIVSVPQYTNLTVNTSASITAPAWNGYQGGIVMFKASENTVLLGDINVTGKGFRGGQDGIGDDAEGGTGEGVTGWGYNPEAGDYPAGDWEVAGTCMQDANGIGGAGSWCSNDNGGDPGAGGGYGTTGQNVDQDQGDPDSVSEGGSSIGGPHLSRMYFGGGGGAGSDNDNRNPEGDGGAGGGIVYIASKTFNGSIYANGHRGYTDITSASSGIGGGGAGGTIWIIGENLSLSTLNATGGLGAEDANEPGGIGGDGRIRLDYNSLSGTSEPIAGYTDKIIEPISTEFGASPFYSIGTNTQSCGFLNSNDSCQLNWTIKVEDSVNTSWDLDVLFYSYLSEVISNYSSSAELLIIEKLVPSINLLSPPHWAGDNGDKTIFSYEVTDANNISNCSLIIDDVVNNISISVEKDVTQNFSVYNLTTGDHYWNINCTNINNYENSSEKRLITIVQSYQFTGRTTDLNTVNVSNIPNLIIEQPVFGIINFSTPVNLSGGANFNDYITIAQNNISIDSNNLPQLNTTAILTIYNLSFAKPTIFKDGVFCTDCNILSYDNNLTFSVLGFSSYSVSENSRLDIWDDSDNETKYITDELNFYANYSNITSGESINGIGISCNITFSDIGTDNMIYNSSNSLYTFNRSFSSEGVHYYNVSCADSSNNYAPLNATDYASINAVVGPVGVNVTVIGSSRGTYNSTEFTAQSGNTTRLSVIYGSITKSWQGFYGEVSGVIYLKDGLGEIFYDWNISQPLGEVYATRAYDVNFADINCTDNSEITAEETFIGHNSTDLDSVTNTFNRTIHPEFYVGKLLIGENSCKVTNLNVDGGIQSSAFYEILLSDGASNIVYTALLDVNQAGFDYQEHGFQMLVGENGNDEETTPYYFFVEII